VVWYSFDIENNSFVYDFKVILPEKCKPIKIMAVVGNNIVYQLTDINGNIIKLPIFCDKNHAFPGAMLIYTIFNIRVLIDSDQNCESIKISYKYCNTNSMYPEHIEYYNTFMEVTSNGKKYSENNGFCKIADSTKNISHNHINNKYIIKEKIVSKYTIM